MSDPDTLTKQKLKYAALYVKRLAVQKEIRQLTRKLTKLFVREAKLTDRLHASAPSTTK